jgi:hypothetical protein
VPQYGFVCLFDFRDRERERLWEVGEQGGPPLRQFVQCRNAARAGHFDVLSDAVQSRPRQIALVEGN